MRHPGRHLAERRQLFRVQQLRLEDPLRRQIAVNLHPSEESSHAVHHRSRVLERSARPVVDGVGRLLGRVEIYRDLTAQRIFQSKLLHTEKLAALGQMATGVAHELSNPLTTILGYAQRLMMRSDAAGRS